MTGPDASEDHQEALADLAAITGGFAYDPAYCLKCIQAGRTTDPCEDQCGYKDFTDRLARRVHAMVHGNTPPSNPSM